MEPLFTLANVLNLSAHFAKNLLLVRTLSLVGAATLAFFAFFRPEPWMYAVYWNLLYVVLNAVKLWQLRNSADRS
jgi:hypothetical protein